MKRTEEKSTPAALEVESQRHEVVVPTDQLSLGEGEVLLSSYDGLDCNCQWNTVVIAKERMHLTNRRIITEETLRIFGVVVMQSMASFLYQDLHHVYVKADKKFRFLIGGALGLYGVPQLVGKDDDAVVVFGVLVLIISILLVLNFLFSLCQKAKVHLDFYREETVNDWLFFLNGLLLHRSGSSVTKSINLKPTERQAFLRGVMGHPLSQFSKTRRPLPDMSGPSSSS